MIGSQPSPHRLKVFLTSIPAHGHNSSANPTSSIHSTTRTKQKCRSMMTQHPMPSSPTHFATWTQLRLQWIRHLRRLHSLFRRHRQLSFQLRHLSLTALRLRARSRQRGRQYINSTTSSTIPLLFRLRRLLFRLRRLLQRLTRLFAPPPFPLLPNTSRSRTSKLLARRLLCLRLRVHHLRLRPGCLQ